MTSNSAIVNIKYAIKPYDTLWDIAGRYNTTIEAIMAANPGIDPYNLAIGQVITVPDPPFGFGFRHPYFHHFYYHRPFFPIPIPIPAYPYPYPVPYYPYF